MSLLVESTLIFLPEDFAHIADLVQIHLFLPSSHITFFFIYDLGTYINTLPRKAFIFQVAYLTHSSTVPLEFFMRYHKIMFEKPQLSSQIYTQDTLNDLYTGYTQ